MPALLAPSPAQQMLRQFQTWKLTDFDYAAPKNLIAKYPAEPRHEARMMVVDRAAGTVTHKGVSDLPGYFGKDDVLVVNDTEVFSARLRGKKERSGGQVEVFLVRELRSDQHLWDALVEPARKVRVGNKVVFADGLEAEIIDSTTTRGRTIRFCFSGPAEELYARIEAIGETPIPPYLRRPAEPEDRERFQSVFASQRGAVTAPAACLHFTDELVNAIEAKGARVAPVTLHAGLGTFQPVECEDLNKHHTDAEHFAVSEHAAQLVSDALADPDRTVTCASCTTVRALESSRSVGRAVRAGEGWTDAFIRPPHGPEVADRLLTNFHRPCSTPLMLTSAFCGHDLLMFAYEEAIREEYRLFAYGDAMLIV